MFCSLFLQVQKVSEYQYIITYLLSSKMFHFTWLPSRFWYAMCLNLFYCHKNVQSIALAYKIVIQKSVLLAFQLNLLILYSHSSTIRSADDRWKQIFKNEWIEFLELRHFKKLRYQSTFLYSQWNLLNIGLMEEDIIIVQYLDCFVNNNNFLILI